METTKRRSAVLLLLLSMVASAGCYRATCEVTDDRGCCPGGEVRDSDGNCCPPDVQDESGDCPAEYSWDATNAAWDRFLAIEELAVATPAAPSK